jgi:hypothetical protein
MWARIAPSFGDYGHHKHLFALGEHPQSRISIHRCYKRYRGGAMRVAWRGGLQGYRGEAMQDLGYELPRISIPRIPMNKGKRVGDAWGGKLRQLLSMRLVLLAMGKQPLAVASYPRRHKDQPRFGDLALSYSPDAHCRHFYASAGRREVDRRIAWRRRWRRAFSPRRTRRGGGTSR